MNVVQTGAVPPPPTVQTAVPVVLGVQSSPATAREATARDAAQERHKPATAPARMLSMHDMRTILNLPSDARDRRGSGPGGEQVDVYA